MKFYHSTCFYSKNKQLFLNYYLQFINNTMVCIITTDNIATKYTCREIFYGMKFFNFDFRKICMKYI